MGCRVKGLAALDVHSLGSCTVAPHAVPPACLPWPVLLLCQNICYLLNLGCPTTQWHCLSKDDCKCLTTTSMTAQVRVGLGQDFFQTDCRGNRQPSSQRGVVATEHGKSQHGFCDWGGAHSAVEELPAHCFLHASRELDDARCFGSADLIVQACQGRGQTPRLIVGGG